MNYDEGTLLWYWFENWIVAGGFAVTLVLTVIVAVRSSWAPRGLLVKTLMAVAALAVLPLTLIRLELRDAVPEDLATEELMVGYLSLAGAVGSVILGIPYLIAVRRLSDARWRQIALPQYTKAAAGCEHFRSYMVKGSFAEPQSTAIAAANEELPPILKAISTSREPRSRQAREARRDFQRGLRRYVFGAKYATRLFAEFEKGSIDRAVWEQTSQAARDAIAVRVSSRILRGSEDMAKANAYFKSTNR